MKKRRRYIAIWRYRVKPGKISAFVAAYANGGVWSALFSQSPDYISTTLVRDRVAPSFYITIDKWRSEAGFDAFKSKFVSQYEELDQVCDALTESEELILEGEQKTNEQPA